MTLFFIAVITAILEVAAIMYLGIGVANIDLVVIVLVFFSLKKGFRTGALLGLFFGILNGFLGISAVWLNILLYSFMGFMVGYIGQWLYKEKLLTFVLMVFCSMVVIYLSGYISKLIYLQIQLEIADYFVRLFLPQAAYTAVASIILFHFLRQLKV